MLCRISSVISIVTGATTGSTGKSSGVEFFIRAIVVDGRRRQLGTTAAFRMLASELDEPGNSLQILQRDAPR